MKSEPREKKFDCVKWTREVRDRINEQIADMSGEELREWLSQRPTAGEFALKPQVGEAALFIGEAGILG